MPLRLLHISDIHFRSESHGWDEDLDQRKELLRDLASLVTDGGPIDGVVVGGDIAFSAQPDQYETARVFLNYVLKVGKQPDTSRVWTVPGNHDIDQTSLKTCWAAQDFRSRVRTVDLPGLDYVLRQRLSEDPHSANLMVPLENYNDFAGEYGCVTVAKNPQWFDETLSFDGWALRLTGLNSVLSSDLEDDEHHEGRRLVLGQQQCRIHRKEGVIDVVMAHHPPSWIRDWVSVEPYLRRAHLWLFGHVHAYAARQVVEGGSVEVLAGALGPERTLEGEMEPYVPTYNLITLRRCDDHTLGVQIQPRYWRMDMTCFAPYPGGDGEFKVAVDLAAENGAAMGDDVSDETDSSEPDPTAASPLVDELPPDSTPAEVEDRGDLRRLGIEYMKRPVSERRDIGRALGVLSDEDLQLPSAELFPLILKRVRDGNLIGQLRVELNR